MKLFCHYLTTMLLLLFIQQLCAAQDSSNASIAKVSTKYLDKISKKAGSVDEKIDAKTTKVLQRFQRREEKIKQKLYRIDSLAANNIFNTAEQRYKSLEQKLNNPQGIAQYIPFLDTLKTSLKFLDKNKELLAKTGDLQTKMDAAMTKVNGLEDQLQKAEDVKQFLKQEKQLLKEQLEKFGFANQLKKLNKDVYYYGQQIAEYKETIKDPQKAERKAIDLLSRTKIFQDFMKKNSMLASLFRMPVDDPNDPAYLQSLAGLQTRGQVNQLIQNQVGSGGPDAMQQIQANVQQAQGELQQLKDKISQYGSHATDEDMPNFKPNNQKTKSLLKRLEYGTSMQTQRSNALFPVTSDIGLSLGYKLNDKSIIGIGAGYKMGWGQNFRHMKITNQGVDFRSYIDYKLKGSFWLSGGYEMNYYKTFKKIEQLQEMSAWQRSGLIGISKKFPINTKFLKNTKLQLLWDFLSYSQVPRGQPIIWRVGYSIK